MQSFLQIFNLAADIVLFVIFAQFILSWLVVFDVVNTRNQFVGSLWRGLNSVTEPVYRPIRNFLPAMGGIDFSPLVVIFGIYALRIIVNNNLAPIAYG
ncbi:MAG: YggT family protein [Paracoccaceae bacterium]